MLILLLYSSHCANGCLNMSLPLLTLAWGISPSIKTDTYPMLLVLNFLLYPKISILLRCQPKNLTQQKNSVWPFDTGVCVCVCVCDKLTYERLPNPSHLASPLLRSDTIPHSLPMQPCFSPTHLSPLGDKKTLFELVYHSACLGGKFLDFRKH